ncbi:hypothetical protein ACMFMG_000371 [Clarireedia jacksonii]
MSSLKRILEQRPSDSDEDVLVLSKRGRYHPPPVSRTASPDFEPAEPKQTCFGGRPRLQLNSAKPRDESSSGKSASASKGPVKTYNDVLGDTFITLYISPSKTRFTIHTNLLKLHCPMFVDSLNIPATDIPATDIEFYEHPTPFLNFSVTNFAAIVEFLYKKAVPIYNKRSTTRGEIARLMEIYQVAETMPFRLAKNVLVTQIGILYLANGKRPSIAEVKYVYTRTQKDCGLRKLVAGHLAFVNLTAGKKGKKAVAEGKRGGPGKEIQPDDINELMVEFPELGKDIVNICSGWLKDGRTGVLRLGKSLICEVHEHPEGKTRCRDHEWTWSERVGEEGESEE